MNATVESVVEVTKPSRARAPRKSVTQATKSQGDRLAKSSDPSLVKASFYLPVAVAQKLSVAAIIRGRDMSDVAAEILGRELSSVTFYEKPSRTPDQTLTVEKIDTDVAA